MSDFQAFAKEFGERLQQFSLLMGEGDYAGAQSLLQSSDRLISAAQSPEHPNVIPLWEKLKWMAERIREREGLLSRTIDRLDASHSALKAVEARLQKENAGLRQNLQKRFSADRIIGASPKMVEVFKLARRVAETSVNVLVTGETGTGKELAAKVIHYSGHRRHAPFTAVNCTAIPEALFESEFFGIEKGVATGVEKRAGLFEKAGGGTLFLDEIGDMPEASQAKILRVLETGEVTPVGAREPTPVDIRLVSATNREIEQDIEEGRFRRDLFYRIKVVRLRLPPLRERGDDVLLLAQHFLRHHAERMGHGKMTFGKRAGQALAEYSWPGNVRELENEIERAVALSSSPEIRLDDLSEEIRNGRRKGLGRWGNGTGLLKQVEMEAIDGCLKRCGGNRTKAAKILGISRESLRRKLRAAETGNPAADRAFKDAQQ